MRMLLFFGLMISLAISGSAVSQVPTTMSYQGYVCSPSGNPLQGGIEFVFRLYDAKSEGTLLWEETDTLEVATGQFHAILGVNNPLNPAAFSGQTLWFETMVDGHLLPTRQAVVTVGYAFKAKSADEADHAATADTANVALSSVMTGGKWETDGTNVWREGGNVGIGNSSPVTKLDVAGGGRFLWFNEIRNNGGLPPALALINTNSGRQFNLSLGEIPGYSGNFDIVDETGGGLSRLTIAQNGYVGIGNQNPIFPLDVSGITRSTQLSTTSQVLGNGSCAADLQFNNLTFNGTYGYGIGDEYIQFNSNFNPDSGGQGILARITAYRNPTDYDYAIGRMKFTVRSGSGTADAIVVDPAGVTINGDLCVTGSKNAIVPTSQGMTKVYCDESTENWFADRGKAEIVNGSARIELDARFLETVTIDENHPMMVQVTPVSPRPVSFSVVEGTASFIILCDQPVTFNWKVEAKRRGYEDVRMEPATADASSGAR